MDLALDRDSTQACFEAGLLDSLKAGTTTIIDHHCSPSYIEGSLSLLAETSEKLGLNISTAFEISDRNGHEKIEASLQENIDAIKKFSGTPHVHPMLGLHASFTLSDSSLAKIRDSVGKLDCWGIHSHVSEDKADEADAVILADCDLERCKEIQENIFNFDLHRQPEDYALITAPKKESH